jgi:hypothetical protein
MLFGINAPGRSTRLFGPISQAGTRPPGSGGGAALKGLTRMGNPPAECARRPYAVRIERRAADA